MNNLKLQIADIIIQMRSKYALEPLDDEKKMNFRFTNFLYHGRKKADITIDVNIVKELPKGLGAKDIFITYHFQNGSENWRIAKKGKYYIYKSPMEDKKQFMRVNGTYDKVTAYLLPKNEKNIFDEKKQKFIKKQKGYTWNISDIIYDFLQVLLINYLALTKKDGIFVHGMGVKDVNNNGLLFTGKSGAGKSTLAKIYHKHSKALVLNDDRIIARKINNEFYIYGSPWHGDFSDYLKSHIDRAKLRRVFFLQKAKSNSIKNVSVGESFKYLYPAIFPTFWDREGIETITSFLSELLTKVSCFRLKFEKNKSVIDFVRKIK